MSGEEYEYQNADPTDPFRFENAPEHIRLQASGQVSDARVGDLVSLAATYEVVDRDGGTLDLIRYRGAEGLSAPEEQRFPVVAILAALLASAAIVAIGLAALR